MALTAWALLASLAAPALATAYATDALIRLERAFSQGKRKEWQAGITKRSLPLAARLERYRLERAIPKGWKALEEDADATQSLVTVGIPQTKPGKTGWQKQRLTFHLEDGVWKLDLPDTLERALGPNWEKQIAMAEQLYAMLEKSMGPEKSDQLLVQVLSGMKKPKDALAITP